MAKRTKKFDPQDLFYRSILPLAAYIDRIGAEQLNFRRFMVKEYSGVRNYYNERAIIKIEPDGTIYCSKKDYEPTKAEAEAIIAAMEGVEFPTAIGARSSDQLKPLLGTGSTFYEFWSRGGKGDAEIIMVQERIPLGDGNKKYVPWTFFSDGKWRRLEPDGDLPFWMPKVDRNKPKIMVHEGPKAAKFVDELINDPKRRDEFKAHPYGEALAEYEHWGMIGGALAPHRSRYGMLKAEKPDEIVYVCDHDHPGESVLQHFSKAWGGHLKGIMFGDKFPPSFDLADAMPATLFHRGRYIGPSLAALMKPATFATEAIPNPAGTGRPITKMKPPFRDEWYHSITPECFVHVDWPDRLLSATEFNSLVAPFSEVDETARLLKKEDSSKAMALKYDPSIKEGVYGSEQTGRFINTHVPSSILPEKGDASPFLDFMSHLIPDDKDRHEMLRWIATLLARPSIKMLYGVLLISETQGVGKSTLGEKILAPLMGENNVSYPSENEIVDSSFNYWLSHKRLAVVHEIYAGHSLKGYNRLKNVITDKHITVSKKYVANYEIENWIHIFACSNSLRAVQLSVDDRRWLVPRITDKKKPAEWWGRLNNWLGVEGGLGIILWWASEFLKKNEAVVPGEDAPWTSTKAEVIEEGMSPGQLLVSNVLDAVAEDNKGKIVVILDTDLVALVRDQLYEGKHNDRLEKPATLRKIAKNKGWSVADVRAHIAEWGTRYTNPRWISNDAETSRRLPSELAKEGIVPFKLADFATKLATY